MIRLSSLKSVNIAARCVFIGIAAAAMVVAFKPSRVEARTSGGENARTAPATVDITTPLALRWKFTSTYFGYNPSSPAVVGDTVYFASGNRVFALDSGSGALKWRYPQDQTPLNTTIRTTPAVVEGYVFFGAEDGKLYALDAKSGKYLWAFDTRGSGCASPTVVDGTIYFGSGDGRVWAVDAKTGLAPSAWKSGFRTSDEITGAPAVSNGFVYALSSDQVLHAIGSATGKERWSYRMTGSVLRQAPITSGDYLFIANGPNITSLLSRNGALRWDKILNADITVTPAVTDDAIYVVTGDNVVRCLDPRLGKDKWKVLPKLEYDVIAAPTVAGRTLFVGTTMGGMYGIDTETGAIKWTYSVMPSSTSDDLIAVRTNVAASPVVAGKSVYVMSDDGTVSCFRPDAIDTAGPEITDTEPEMGVVINGAPPLHFEAKIVDEGSGINPASVKFLLDGNGVTRRPSGPENDDKPGYKFDVVTSTLSYDTMEATTAGAVRNLPDGRHTVSVVASDWKGNTSKMSWSFTVDNSLAKLSKKPNPNTVGAGGAGLGGRSGGSGGNLGGRGGGGLGGGRGGGGLGGGRGGGGRGGRGGGYGGG